MTGFLLFARSRRWLVILITGLVSAGLIVACGPLSYTLNPAGGYHVAVASQIPLIVAIGIQAALASPVARQEWLSSRSLRKWRVMHVLGLTAVIAGLLALAALSLQPPVGVSVNGYFPLGPLAIVRNLLAFTGAALVCAAVCGPALGWILAVGWAIIPVVALPSPAADPSGIISPVAQPDDAFARFWSL